MGEPVPADARRAAFCHVKVLRGLLDYVILPLAPAKVLEKTRVIAPRENAADRAALVHAGSSISSSGLPSTASLLIRVAARRRVRHLDGICERKVAQVADVDGAAVAAPEEAAEAKGVLESRRAARAKGAEPRRRLRERGEDEHAGERLALDGGDLAVGEGEEDTEGAEEAGRVRER